MAVIVVIYSALRIQFFKLKVNSLMSQKMHKSIHQASSIALNFYCCNNYGRKYNWIPVTS